MADPDGVRQAARVLRPGRLNRLVERIPQEILAGLRLDGDEPIQVAGLQHSLQLLGVNPLGTLDDRFRVGDTMSAPFLRSICPDYCRLKSLQSIPTPLPNDNRQDFPHCVSDEKSLVCSVDGELPEQ